LKQCSSTDTGIGKQNVIKSIIPSSQVVTLASTTQSEGNIPYISALVSYNTGSRSIVINSNIFITSNNPNNSNEPNELAKIIYNGIYWCLKISK
jgi:archaellin